MSTSLLLDTHVLLWVATRDARLGSRARDAIRDGDWDRIRSLAAKATAIAHNAREAV